MQIYSGTVEKLSRWNPSINLLIEKPLASAVMQSEKVTNSSLPLRAILRSFRGRFVHSLSLSFFFCHPQLHYPTQSVNNAPKKRFREWQFSRGLPTSALRSLKGSRLLMTSLEAATHASGGLYTSARVAHVGSCGMRHLWHALPLRSTPLSRRLPVETMAQGRLLLEPVLGGRLNFRIAFGAT